MMTLDDVAGYVRATGGKWTKATVRRALPGIFTVVAVAEDGEEITLIEDVHGSTLAQRLGEPEAYGRIRENEEPNIIMLVVQATRAHRNCKRRRELHGTDGLWRCDDQSPTEVTVWQNADNAGNRYADTWAKIFLTQAGYRLDARVMIQEKGTLEHVLQCVPAQWMESACQALMPKDGGK